MISLHTTLSLCLEDFRNKGREPCSISISYLLQAKQLRKFREWQCDSLRPVGIMVKSLITSAPSEQASCVSLNTLAPTPPRSLNTSHKAGNTLARCSWTAYLLQEHLHTATFWNMKSWEVRNSTGLALFLLEAILSPKLAAGVTSQPPSIIWTVASSATPSRKLNIDMIVALLCYCGYRALITELKNQSTQLSVRPTQLTSHKQLFPLLSWGIFLIEYIACSALCMARLKLLLTACQLLRGQFGHIDIHSFTHSSSLQQHLQCLMPRNCGCWAWKRFIAIC